MFIDYRKHKHKKICEEVSRVQYKYMVFGNGEHIKFNIYMKI